MGSRPRTPSSHKELRTFLEEEHKAYVARLRANKDSEKDAKEKKQLSVDDSDEGKMDHSLIQKDEASGNRRRSTSVLVAPEAKDDDDDGENRKQRGKENVERWLQMLLDEKDETRDESNEKDEDVTQSATAEAIKISVSESQGSLEVRLREEPNITKVQIDEEQPPKAENAIAAAAEGKNEKGKEKGLGRSESARILRRIPSSPAMVIGGLKKGVVSCMTKKPLVFDDAEGDENRAPITNFIKSPFRIIKKKSVKL